MPNIDHIPGILKRLYEIVAELELHFPGRKFTPDGHLVGSLGEVLAAYHYELELLPCSTECYDAKALDGRLVQIKATQGSQVGLRAEPKHLIVLRLLRNGSVSEIYNGPGADAWKNAGAMQRNGQRSIRVLTLTKLMKNVSLESRLPLAKALN